MKKNVYSPVSGLLLLLLFYLFPNNAVAQTCSGLAVTITTSESRCMATGVITVNVTGGSGSYNYKVSGPVTTSFTSSNVITGLQPGAYKVIVRDITKNCQVEQDSVVVSGSYSDPRFVLTKTDATCIGNDGTITVSNQQFGRAPFSYTIVAPSPAGVGTTNTSGVFTNLIAGAYVVQLKDSCGGIQVRRVTLEGYSWWFDGVTVTKTDCNNADAVIRLKDNKGNLNTSSTTFDGFTYGIVNTPGDTTWSASNSFSFYIGNKRSVTFVANDGCGNRHSYSWNVPSNAKPSVSTIGISNTTCTQFTATVNGKHNLTNPQFYLYDADSTELANNTTGIFPNLVYGDYCIQIKDACYDTTIVRCFTSTQPTPSIHNTVAISNQDCASFTAAITGQSALFNPDYCLYDSSHVLLSCNSTGVFTNIAYGSYCIKTTDGCTGTVIDRCFTVAKPIATLTNVSVTGQNCSSFDATASGTNLVNPQYCLYDSAGNVVTCNATGIFTGIANGNYCIRAISCGDTTTAVCVSGIAPKPAVAASVQITNKACSTFTASITSQVYFTAPQFCLYNNADSLLNCNTTGVFDSVAYGSYCIKITDGCYDTTILRCFTQNKPAPVVNATMQQSNATCTTFTAKVTGQQNLFDPQYCLYDADENLVECNTTGIFNNLPYGKYCVAVTDACTNDTIRVCQTFVYKYSIALASSKSCIIGSANVGVSFVKGNSPFAIDVFNPDDSLVYSGTATTTKHIVLPGLAAGSVYTVIGTDACGKKDTATIAPDVSVITKSITAISKCPSAMWLDGSGDLKIDAASNLSTVTPKLIKKDSVTFSKTHSSNTGTVYVFSDLEPATYVVEYSIENCSTKLYDTFALQPYAYPTQGQSSIYQCDNKSISLSAEVAGGVGPYGYQIIGSEPEIPSIASAEQASPFFNINTGTTYSLIRLRTIDACGNATLNDVSVLPLQNIQISADTTCLFSNVTLSVDTIPGATYSWYKKRGTSDSLFLTDAKTYNIPLMRTQDIGDYVCKLELNNSCLTRLASFKLSGDCGDIFLPVPVALTGKTETGGNTLSWSLTGEAKIQYYEIERKAVGSGSFTTIGTVAASSKGTTARYQFTDTSLLQGTVQYRLKMVQQDGRFDYTNSVSLQRDLYTTTVYPNPVHTHVMIQFNGTTASNYHIELLNMAGQVVFKSDVQNVTRLQQRYERPKGLQHGMYLLKITNRTNGETIHHKLLFD